MNTKKNSPFSEQHLWCCDWLRTAPKWNFLKHAWSNPADTILKLCHAWHRADEWSPIYIHSARAPVSKTTLPSTQMLRWEYTLLHDVNFSFHRKRSNSQSSSSLSTRIFMLLLFGFYWFIHFHSSNPLFSLQCCCHKWIDMYLVRGTVQTNSDVWFFNHEEHEEYSGNTGQWMSQLDRRWWKPVKRNIFQLSWNMILGKWEAEVAEEDLFSTRQ